MSVRSFIAADCFPPRRQNTPRFSPIHRFLPYLKQRWEQGEHSSRALWKEIKTQGYPGAEVTLRHFLQRWRVSSSAEIKAHTVTKSLPGRAPSIRRVKWLLFSPEKRKEEWEAQFANELCRQSEEVDCARKLVRDFHRLMSERRADGLQGWLEAARASGIGELVCFANGWSQGQVEGQVNRLKFIKRSAYGRAKFDLLKARVLYRQAV